MILCQNTLQYTISKIIKYDMIFIQYDKGGLIKVLPYKSDASLGEL